MRGRYTIKEQKKWIGSKIDDSLKFIFTDILF
jgi:hypothetical protein